MSFCQKLTDFWHENLTNLPTLRVRCSHFTLGNPKKLFSTLLFTHTSDSLCYLRRKPTVIHLPTPPENVTTLTCELQNFFYLTEVLLPSTKRWRLWVKRASGRRWLWKELVVMCGMWNVRQAVSQQVFRVTTFYVNTCFQSFSTLISRIVHQSVLIFSPCRNKLLPQASTCPYQYRRSSCSVHQTQY